MDAKRLLDLCDAPDGEEHLEALIRHNASRFLNPNVVDCTAPPRRQLSQYIEHMLSTTAAADCEALLADIEVALKSGECAGFARDADSDEEEGDDDTEDAMDADVDLDWRKTPTSTWSTILRNEAKQAKDCLMTPLGHCIGPLRVRPSDWLSLHLPATLALLGKKGMDTAAGLQRAVEALAQSIDGAAPRAPPSTAQC